MLLKDNPSDIFFLAADDVILKRKAFGFWAAVFFYTIIASIDRLLLARLSADGRPWPYGMQAKLGLNRSYETKIHAEFI